MSWRRLADWKHEVTLVLRSKLGERAELDPVARMRTAHPEWAWYLAEAGFVRVGAYPSELLAAGAMRFTVHDRRGTDGRLSSAP